jgi:hypothetical protein
MQLLEGSFTIWARWPVEAGIAELIAAQAVI